MSRYSVSARHKARECALQALYQWQLTANDLAEIEAQYIAEEPDPQLDEAYFLELLHQVPAKHEDLEKAFAPFLDRTVQKLDPIERSILWISSYELSERDDVPFRVVINEAVELAKRYGAEGGHKYINGVLDKLAQVLRTSSGNEG